MSKLNEKELLSILTAVFSYYLSKCNYKETATKYEEAHQQIKEMIQGQGVTEEWIGEKAGNLATLFCRFIEIGIENDRVSENYILTKAKDFIRSLIEEIQGEK